MVSRVKIWTPRLVAVFAILLAIALYRQCAPVNECRCNHAENR